LGHERIGISLLRQQNRYGTGPNDDTAATDGDEQIGPRGSGGLNPLLHSRPTGILIHRIEDPSIEHPKLILHPLEQIGFVRHRAAADDKGALGLRAPYLVGQLIERIHSHMQAPGITHGSEVI
jgi:hypothetical protein